MSRLPGVVLVLLLTVGCTVSVEAGPRNETPHATAPTDRAGVEVWDLRTPPSAADVGIRADRDYVAYETDEPRRVRFLLPEGRELTIDASLVVFDRVSHTDPTDPTRPTGIDFRMPPVPVDEAYDVMRRSLRAFGLATAPVERWRHDIETRPTTGTAADRRIEGGGNTRIGYLTIGVGGVFDPIDQDDQAATVKYRVNLY